jgi:ankyrin repeat protein
MPPQLLDEGADIHVIAPKRQYGGSALAEAITGKHEALVELLLRYGADPFTENPAGKTPLDLALEARAVNIVRACERQSLFAGYVSTRVSPALLQPSCQHRQLWHYCSSSRQQ